MLTDDMQKDARFALGQVSGRFDAMNEIESDVLYFYESGFDLKDQPYVQGYKRGYDDVRGTLA